MTKKLEELNKKERKRLQNRLAQQVYRRNQKERIRTLEAAIANVASFSLVSPSGSSNEMMDSGNEVPEVAVVETPEAVTSFEEVEGPSWDIITGQSESFQAPAASQSALHRAIQNGNEPMTRLLLEHGADTNMRDNISGNTALHLATQNESEEIMRLLLDSGADPHATNYSGHTPLFSAVQGDNKAAAKVLLGASPPIIDINWKDATGMNALHLAVERGFESMARLLLTHYGADVNA